MPITSREIIETSINRMPKNIVVPSVIQENEQRHTDEIQEIIGAPPAWLLRWGITIFFTVLVSILGLTELITYPDTVRTQLKIRSLNLPEPIIIKTSGELIKLLVKNNQEVKTGQPLVYIKSAGGVFNITASQTGKLTYAAIIHENQELFTNQTIFHITANDKGFFGEMLIPQGSMGRVKEGQAVIIKLQSYPYQEYGILHGTIKYITDGILKEKYIAEVNFNTNNLTDMHKLLTLKQGMVADAEIIMQNSTLFKRLTANILKNTSH